jgi:transposase
MVWSAVLITLKWDDQGKQHRTEDHRMHIASIGIGLGKTTFHLVALDAHSKIVLHKKFSRYQLLVFTAKLEKSLIGMEACSGAHFLGSALRDQGHEVRLIPAQFVKPFVKSIKNDFRDAEAIAEAVIRHNMRFVPIKNEEQLDLQALHRVRDRLVQRRTAVINQVRGFLFERGIAFPKGPAGLRRHMPFVIEDADNRLRPRMRTLLDRLWVEWRQLDYDVEMASEDIERIAAENEDCRRLRQIRGVGPLVATATVAAIGNGAAFHKGREFAAWLGLVPNQYSTGGKTILGRISKRGNKYLRRMFIHGARAVLLRVKYDTEGLGQWVHRLEQRMARNKVVVAIANKLARIAWSVLFKEEDYRHSAVCAA